MNINSANNPISLTLDLQSANNGRLSTGDIPVSEALKTGHNNEVGDQVSLSATSLFLFELNTYANSLAHEERYQFADALEASGDPAFSQGFLDSMRYSMSVDGISVEESTIRGDIPMSDDQGGVIAEYGGSIPYNGMTTNYLDDYAAAGKSGFSSELQRILTDAPDDLTQQDRASIESTFDRAIYSSYTALQSDFDIFSTNYQFLIAQDAIDGFTLSEETSSKLSTFLSDIKENNLQVNAAKVAQDIRDASNFPGYSSKILASAEKTREGIELSNLLQTQMDSSGSSLLEQEDYFTKLMQSSNSIEVSSEADYGGLFDYYKVQENSFKQTFIEQNHQMEKPINTDNGPVVRLNEPETVLSTFASKYIDSVNAYLSTQEK